MSATDVLVRADAFVRTKGHDPYTRISEADELIEELSGEVERLRAALEELAEPAEYPHAYDQDDWSRGVLELAKKAKAMLDG